MSFKCDNCGHDVPALATACPACAKQFGAAVGTTQAIPESGGTDMLTFVSGAVLALSIIGGLGVWVVMESLTGGAIALGIVLQGLVISALLQGVATIIRHLREISTSLRPNSSSASTSTDS